MTRSLRRSKLRWLNVVVIVSLLGSSLFARLVEGDPPDLQVVLRSATGSNRFRVGEVIPLEVLFSSTTANRYLEPCALFRESNFGFPQCRFLSHWSFAISPEDGWLDYTKAFAGPQTFGGPTFEVPPRTLAATPVAFAYFLTNRFRFDKPGDYKITFQTEVGLNDPAIPLTAPRDASRKVQSVPITREIMLSIVPADAEWQKDVVRKGAEAWLGPRPPNTNPPSAGMLEYQQAKRALCALGTPEAARVLAKAILPSDYEALTCLERSPSVAAGVDEMQRLLVDPDTPVTTTFFSALVGLLNLEESKKVGGLFLFQDTVNKERDTLFNALPQKRGDAQIESLATVLQNPPRTELDIGGRAYDLPFPPQVISVAAENLDRLPYRTQKVLLEDGWNRIRSRLMLPAVRRRAGAGDGPALLRWLELDPAAATLFIRAEIVRPQPRFSSYYLRLPEASLPGQEKQIAANFAAFATLNDDHNLVHSATLLHRYASAAVLPVVLPFIDAKLTDWPCSIQVPVLAYLLKVSPEQAALRVQKVLGTPRIQVCTGRSLTTLGLLEPGPVLQAIALTQVEAGTPNAQDGAEYLRSRAPPEVKATIWKQLEKWHHKLVSNGITKRWNAGVGTAEDREKHYFFSELTRAFEAAQGWVLTPDDERKLLGVLDEETIKGLRCRFACGAPLSVGPEPGQYAIRSHPNPTPEQRDNENESMEYLNSVEPLSYSINQYRCANLKALEEKLLQFPPGSTFLFGDEFSERDRNELIEISNFLQTHGYKVNNTQNWTFLTADTSR